MKLGFLITCYDQTREASFTLNMLRNKWNSTKDSPVVIVISGDPDRKLKPDDVNKTRVVNLDDMVGKDFNGKVSSSIMKQIEHGMIELLSLEEGSPVDVVVHMHGDILLLNEQGFLTEVEKFLQSGKVIGCDTVGPQNTDYISFRGTEIMPQLFVVNRNHPLVSMGGFMMHMSVQSLNEKKSTEWALKENLRRAAANFLDTPAHELECLTDRTLEDCYMHIVSKHRPVQWGLHAHFGGFCHFGNQLHFPKEIRERRNEAVLRSHQIDLSCW